MNVTEYEICDDWGWYVDTENNTFTHSFKRINNDLIKKTYSRYNDNLKDVDYPDCFIIITRFTIITCAFTYLLFGL